MLVCPGLRQCCLIFFLFVFFFALPVSVAAQTAATESATVTANVQVTTPPYSDTIAPSAPILIRPTDGSHTSDPTPEFVWRQSQDPNSNYVSYTLYLNDVATYLGVSNTGSSSGTDYVSTIDGTEVRLIPTRGLADGVYKWKVSASDFAGNTTFSTEWTLTIDTLAPPITITDIDVHHDLQLSSLDPSSVPDGTTFEVTGPKDIYFTIISELYTTLTLTFYDSSHAIVGSISVNTGNSTVVYPFHHLEPGHYTVQVVATDRANLVTILPTFSLLVVESKLVIPIPGILPPPSLAIPRELSNIVSALYNYPATIARVTSRDSLTLILVASLAIAILLLIIFLKKRYNLILLDATGKPIPQASVTYYTNLQVPTVIELLPKHKGRLYIPHLGRLSELHVAIEGISTSFCLTTNQHTYKVIL